MQIQEVPTDTNNNSKSHISQQFSQQTAQQLIYKVCQSRHATKERKIFELTKLLDDSLNPCVIIATALF